MESRLVFTPMESRLESKTAGLGRHWWRHVTASAPLTGTGGDGDGGRARARRTLPARLQHDIQRFQATIGPSRRMADIGFLGSELGAMSDTDHCAADG